MFEESASNVGIVEFGFWFKCENLVGKHFSPVLQVAVYFFHIQVFGIVAAVVLLKERIASLQCGGFFLDLCFCAQLLQFGECFAVVDVKTHAKIADGLFEEFEILFGHDSLFLASLLQLVKCVFDTGTRRHSVERARIH